MASIDDIEEVYGGPYGDESDALIAEVNDAKREKRKPNFAEVIKDWKTISSGAKKWIKDRPDIKSKPPVGPFVKNVEVDYEHEEKHGINKFPEIKDGGGIKPETEQEAVKSEFDSSSAQPANPDASETPEKQEEVDGQLKMEDSFPELFQDNK